MSKRKYKTIENIVNRFGVDFAPQYLPEKYPLMELGYCFRNAGLLAEEDSKLIYCEGICNRTYHSWAIDLQGRVIDPTWPPSAERRYRGFAFHRDLSWTWPDENDFPILWDAADFPMYLLLPDWTGTWRKVLDERFHGETRIVSRQSTDGKSHASQSWRHRSSKYSENTMT